MGCTCARRALQWAKIALLYQEVLKMNYQWIVWIDADAMFTNFRQGVFELLGEVDEDVSLVVGSDMKSLGRPLNTGWMAVRVGAKGREILREVWRIGAKINKRYLFAHEQESLTRLLDYPLGKKSVLIWQDKVRIFGGEEDENLRHQWRRGDLVGHTAGWPGFQAKVEGLKQLRKMTVF